MKTWNNLLPTPEKPVSDITEIVYVGDMSGSMAGLTNDTIKGFNGFIDTQKKEPGEAYVTVALFNTTVKVIAERQNIQDVPALTTREYQAQGGTALIDAVGSTLTRLEKNPPKGRVLFVVDTDGEENASREYTTFQVKSQIERLTKAGWGFVFLGANDSQWQSSGIGVASAGAYTASSVGVSNKYANLSVNTSSMRASGQSFATGSAGADWNTSDEEQKP